MLPTTGITPITIDSGLNSSQTGFVLAGSGSSTLGPNASRNTTTNSVLNTLIAGGSTNNSNMGVVTDNLGVNNNAKVNNNAESNTGSGNNPPAGNTDKVVYGQILDWDNAVTNELRSFTNSSTGLKTNYFQFSPFTFNEFPKTRRVVIKVETIKFLEVGDIIYSQLSTESFLNFFVRYIRIEIKSITAPNTVYGVYILREGEQSVLDQQARIPVTQYMQRHAWDIIKKPSGGSGSGGNNGGGGGGDTGARVPL